MTTTTTRRQALTGAVALTLSTVAVSPSVVAIPKDPVIDLIERYYVLWPLCPTSDIDPVADARWNEEVSDLERKIAESHPTTRAGAISVLRFIAFKMKDEAADGEMLGALTASIAILARDT